MNTDKLNWIIAELRAIKIELKEEYKQNRSDKISSVHYHIFHAIKHFEIATDMLEGLLPKIEISIKHEA